MATSILRGDDNPQLQKSKYSFSQSNGHAYEESWKGINVNKMTAKYNGIMYSAQEINMSVAHGVAELEVKWAGTKTGGGTGGGDITTNEVTIDRWECPEPRVEKPIFTHPDFIAAIGVLGVHLGLTATDFLYASVGTAFNKAADAQTLFDEFMDSGEIGMNDGTTALSIDGYDPAWLAFKASNSTEAGIIERLYGLACNKQTHYQDSLYSCRHTTNAPANWAMNVADDNVNCIYSPAQFISEVTNASEWIFPLPSRLQYKLSSAATAFAAVTPVRSNYLIGWLKGASAEATVGGGRVEIQTQYTLDQWSTDLYATAA